MKIACHNKPFRCDPQKAFELTTALGPKGGEEEEPFSAAEGDEHNI
jgi:hypothetical protein